MSWIYVPGLQATQVSERIYLTGYVFFIVHGSRITLSPKQPRKSFKKLPTYLQQLALKQYSDGHDVTLMSCETPQKQPMRTLTGSDVNDTPPKSPNMAWKVSYFHKPVENTSLHFVSSSATVRIFTNELTERYRFQDHFIVENFNSGFPFKTKISQILINCGFSFFFFSTSRMNNESHNRTFYSYFKLQIRNQSSLF